MMGGLEITDTALRFVRYDGRAWRTASLRLPPGLIEAGTVKDHDQLVAALRELAAQVRGPRGSRRAINVIVSLSSVNIYSQVFSLPIIRGEELEKAVQLNIQMVSPVESSQAYSGWQLMAQDQSAVRLDVLGAFINRSVVDGVSRALKEAGFLPHAVESRALSLVRLTRELAAGFDRRESYFALILDAAGIEFLIIRRGQLYFQYLNTWKDLYGGERQVSTEALEAVVVRSLHQVMNFYNAHWSELLSGIFISAGSMQERVAQIIADNFSIRPIELQLTLSEPVSPNWFVALGAGLRSLVPRREDAEISLLGVNAQDEFRRRQLVDFLDFWSVLVPVTLGVLLMVFGIADVFLTRLERGLKTNAFFAMNTEQVQSVTDLNRQLAAFNQSVAFIGKADVAASDKGALLENIVTLLHSYDLTLNHLYVQSSQLATSLTGCARTENQILQFKKALDADPRFQGVTLPLSEIRSEECGLSFLINFSIAPAAAR